MATNNKNKEEEEINFNLIGVNEKNEVNGNKETSSFPSEYIKRNKLFLLFFKKFIFPDKDVMLLGDENNPAVVIDNQTILSCYVKIFTLNFLDNNQKGSCVFSVKLTDYLKKENYDIKKILDWYKKYEHRKIYRLYLETKNENIEPPLLLVGWNYKNKDKKEGKYPVFGEHNAKIYFTKEKATEVEKELKDGGYNVIII